MHACPKVTRPCTHHGHGALQASPSLGAAASAVGSDEESGPRDWESARLHVAREGAQLDASTLHHQRRKLRGLAQGMYRYATPCVPSRGLSRHYPAIYVPVVRVCVVLNALFVISHAALDFPSPGLRCTASLHNHIVSRCLSAPTFFLFPLD